MGILFLVLLIILEARNMIIVIITAEWPLSNIAKKEAK